MTLNSSRRSYRAALIVSVFVVVLSVVFFFIEEDSPLRETVVAIAAVVGALAIWFQMKRSKEMAEGEFIVTLNSSFLTNDDVKNLYGKLIRREEIAEEDRTAIVEYLTFFETIYLLMLRDVVDMRMINDLFRHRFFIAVNNPHIQDLELIPDAAYYRNIYTLDYLWREHRARLGDVETSKTSLRLRKPDYDSYVNRRRRRR